MKRVLPALLCCLAAACAPSGAQRAARLAEFRTEDVTGSPPGLPLEDDREWHLAVFHVHTAEGPYEYKSRADLNPRANYDANHARYALRTAATYGVQALFITDHNSLESAFDKPLMEYARTVGVTLVPGTEWSLGGPLGINFPVTLGHAGPHLSLIGYRAQSAKDLVVPDDTRGKPGLEDFRALTSQVHARGGAVVLSHPDAFNHDYALPPAGFDLVEVDGPWVENPGAARHRWHGWLMGGERIGAISSANWRPGLLPGNTFTHVNLVRSPQRTPEALTDALRGGHVMLVTNPRKIPRVLLGADADADGAFDDAREGDVLIPVAGATRVRFQVRVIGARGRALLLYGAGSREPMHKETFSDLEVVRAYSVALRPGQRSFVRAELWEGNTLMVLTNPLYFDPAPPLPEAPDAGNASGHGLGLEGAEMPDLIRIITVDAGPAGDNP